MEQFERALGADPVVDVAIDASDRGEVAAQRALGEVQAARDLGEARLLAQAPAQDALDAGDDLALALEAGRVLAANPQGFGRLCFAHLSGHSRGPQL